VIRKQVAATTDEEGLAVSSATIDTIDVGSLVFEFIPVFALFSRYFENVPSAGINPKRFRSWSALARPAPASEGGRRSSRRLPGPRMAGTDAVAGAAAAQPVVPLECRL